MFFCQIEEKEAIKSLFSMYIELMSLCPLCIKYYVVGTVIQ